MLVAEVFEGYRTSGNVLDLRDLNAALSDRTRAPSVTREVLRVIDRGPRELSALFALEVALMQPAWLASDRLGPVYLSVLERGAERARERRDNFDHQWHRVSVALLTGPIVDAVGAEMPSTSTLRNATEFLRQAANRFEDDGAFALALGFAHEMTFRRRALTSLPEDVIRPHLKYAADAYQRANKDSRVSPYATLRLGAVRALQGDTGEGGRLWRSLHRTDVPKDVRYLAHVLQGQSLAESAELRQAAVDEFTAALDLVPGAPTSRVPLAALLRLTGQREDPLAIVDDLLAPTQTRVLDPYVTFFAPGYLEFSTLMDALRKRAR
jgi:hypothetical protein